MHWHDIIGSVGVALILGAYGLLQWGRLDARGWRYAAANAVGAALVLTSLVQEFNLSAFVVEAAWLVISLAGVVRVMRARR